MESNIVMRYLGNLVNAQLNNVTPDELPEGITVMQLIDIAYRNHMDYLILGALLRVEKLSDTDTQKLRSHVMRSVFHTVTQVRDLKEIQKRFEENYVKNQPMKGAILKFIYPTPEMREMGDIDILIDKKNLAKATDILKDMGYSLSQSVKHHDIYKKSPGMIVEVHRALYDRTVDSRQNLYFESFLKTRLHEGCLYTYEFGYEDFYIYMIAHMAKHFYAMGCGIRNLVDIYVYLKKYGTVMNFTYVREELEKCGLKDFADNMEALTKIWLEQKECDTFYNDLFQYMCDSGIYGKDENGIWNKFANEKRTEKQVTLKKLRKWYYFPPVSYMSEYYPFVEHYTFLLPLAWGIRFFRGVFKKKGVHKREMLQEISQREINSYQVIYQRMGLHFSR